MTDPPIVGDIGLAVARRFGVPLLVISQDVFPEIAVQLKRLENPVLVGVLRSLVGLYLRRADGIVAIGETMKRRLEEKGAASERITVIPNWVDTLRSCRGSARTSGRASESSSASSSSCTPATSGTRRISTRSSVQARSSAISRPQDRDRRLRRPPRGHAGADEAARAGRHGQVPAAISRATCSRSRCPPRTSTSSGSRRASPGSSFPAASTGSSRRGGR